MFLVLDYEKIYYEDYVNSRMTLKSISEKYDRTPSAISKAFSKRGYKVERYSRIDYTNINRIAFDEWTTEMAYWLGFIAADGSVHKNRNQLSVLIQSRDCKHIYKLQKFLNLPNDCIPDRIVFTVHTKTGQFYEIV